MVTDTTAHTHTARVLAEGYGPGAWHGADLKAAIDGITPAATCLGESRGDASRPETCPEGAGKSSSAPARPRRSPRRRSPR